jgi:N-acyl homoserine lactone hydrolase
LQDMIRRRGWLIALLLLASVDGVAASPSAPTLRLYVLDCGALIYNRPEDYGLTREEVASSNMAVSCYLIRHPKGTLLFDTGLADRIVGQSIWENVDEGYAQVRTQTLRAQLAAIGIRPADVTYLALSHSHFDHVGNANDYAHSIWLTPEAERSFMFAADVPEARRSVYAQLAQARSVVYHGDHDVFGDGSVILKATPGHTPGHQSLYVRLQKTGGVLLSGDLYHYAEERTLDRMPPEERSAGTVQARAAMDKFLDESHAELWIGHSIDFFAKARKAPAWYE